MADDTKKEHEETTDEAPNEETSNEEFDKEPDPSDVEETSEVTEATRLENDQSDDDESEGEEPAESAADAGETDQESDDEVASETQAAEMGDDSDEDDSDTAESDEDDSDDDAENTAGDGLDAGRKRPNMPVEQAALNESDADSADDEEAAQVDWAEDDAAEEQSGAIEIDEERVSSGPVAGIAAYFDHPDHLLYAAGETRESKYESFDAYSPFPIHGMDDAMGIGRSWIPWVTFGAGTAGLLTAIGLQFGIMGFDWPMVYGGKPFIAWPSFVPIMFELTVLFAGVTTGLVMLKAAGCFQKPFIIDTDITRDRFVLWISADDENFKQNDVIDFCRGLNPSEIRTVRKDG